MAESDAENIQKAGSEAQNAEDDLDFPPRRGGFRNVMAAVRHINDSSLTDGVKQRVSDYVTIGLVVICILSLFAAVALPVSPGLKMLPLLFTIGAVVLYIVNRLGIIVTLSQRQALIVWQIVVASFWLGVTSSMMVMMTCFYFSTKGYAGMF